MIRTYQRRNKGGESNSQLSDAFSPPRGSDSQDLFASYHSALSSQEGFSEGAGVQQPGVSRLGSLSSRLDLFAFDDEEETEAEKKRPSEKRTAGSSPGKQTAAKKTNSKAEGAPHQVSTRAGLLNSSFKGSLAKSPLLPGGFGHGLRYAPGTVQSSTLMEHQESGEMQESVDEAKFALEGLHPSSSLPILRASLVALVQLLSSSNKRRVLQAHNLGKPLLTAIMALPEGDSLLRLASASVVFFLSMDDVAHRSLLDSDDVIRLVLSFLEQGDDIGETSKGIFASSKGVADQAKKVQRVFQDGMQVDLTGGQVVTPEWLGLLALEQASTAAAQLEQEASVGGAKSSNQFKDRLREQGGLDTICHLAASCEAGLSSDVSKGPVAPRATMLLRCLRILEHVTYVSGENQRHLLKMRLSGTVKGKAREADTCVEVVLGCIGALSQVSGVRGSKRKVGHRQADAQIQRTAGKTFAVEMDEEEKETSAMNGKIKIQRAKSGGHGRAATPVGKWQSAARRKQETPLVEVIPDSDEELLPEKEITRHSEVKDADTGGASPLKEAGRRRSGRFAKLHPNEADVAMDVDHERSCDDVIDEAKDRPAILRTFSRKKQRTEPRDDQKGESTCAKARLNGRRASRDLDLDEADMMDLQKLSSQASLQSTGKRKTKAASQDETGKRGVESSALSAFDFEVEPEAGPSGRGQERKESGVKAGQRLSNKGKLAVKHRTVNCVDKTGVDERSSKSNGRVEDPNGKKERLSGRLAKREDSRRVVQNAKPAATSAFDFKPAVEKEEREGLAMIAKLDSEERELEGRQEVHLELDRALVSECLVTCVKVLMNLTNDNANGCQQIAAAGGIHTIASLLVSCCPPLQKRARQTFEGQSVKGNGSVQASSSPDEPIRSNADISMSDAEVSMSDAEVSPSEDLDLVTVVLALLVNLVEKDRQIRLNLAALEVPMRQDMTREPLEGRVGVVPSLCALFLSKKGAGAKAELAENEAAALEFDEETRLAEGQREAEDMIVEAYAALLIALLAKDDARARKVVAEILPEGNASSLAPVLDRFMNFHLQMNTFSQEAHEALLELIETCKGPSG